MFTVAGKTITAVALGVGILAAGTAAQAAQAAEPGGFAACMREHGVAGFPEATFTGDGRVTLPADGTWVDVFGTAYTEALEACRDRLPDGITLPVLPTLPKGFAPPSF